MKSNKYNYIKYFDDPFVCVYDNVLNDDECLHFINLSKNKLNRALVSNNKSGYVSKGRTGSNTWINHNHDQITQDVSKRIANIAYFPNKPSRVHHINFVCSRSKRQISH